MTLSNAVLSPFASSRNCVSSSPVRNVQKKKIVQSEMHQGWKFSGEFVYTPREENKKGGGVSLSHNLVHIKTDKIIVWSMKT